MPIRYYLEGRDEAFEQKMAEILCVYQEVAALRANDEVDPKVAIVSYDEKPGIQAISNTALDLPPVPGVHPCIARDHENSNSGSSSILRTSIVIPSSTPGATSWRYPHDTSRSMETSY